MRYYGKIGYVVQGEDPEHPGVIRPTVVERNAYGDVKRVKKTNVSTENFNSDIRLDNEFSILYDKYMEEHYANIAYICMNGVKWAVSSVDVSNPPRFGISVNGVYNGPTEDGGYGPQS